MNESGDKVSSSLKSDDFQGDFVLPGYAALRGNEDYLAVLQTLVKLEAQLCQATRDIDIIEDVRRRISENPKEALKLLVSGDLVVPEPIKLAELPEIDLRKNIENAPGPSSSAAIPSTSAQARPNESPKTRTKNLWSKEEQRRLEELLIEFPTEKVEMQRFAKIAKAIGTRTTRQVASRCQKYFRTLYLAGLPVPGRLPKASRHSPYGSRYDKYTKTGMSLSFFPEFDVPVRMNVDGSSDEEVPNYLTEDLPRTSGQKKEKVCEIVSEPVELPEDSTFNDHIKGMLIRLRDDKLKDETKDERRPDSLHMNFICFRCRNTPINGTRWHCQECNDPAIDFCSDCLVSECLKPIDLNQHPVNHSVIGLRQRKSLPRPLQRRIKESVKASDESSSSSSTEDEFFFDEDYSAARINSSASYLDPSYPSSK